MIILALLFVLVLAIIIIFAFPQFSPIPYFPSNPKDLIRIIKALDLKNNQVVFDLGAGDGIIIFAAAAESANYNLNTRFVAVEMNPILALILHIRRLLHPNKHNISIICDDMFKVPYRKYALKNKSVTVYIYVSPRFIPKITATIKTQFSAFKLVSYYYPIEKNQRPHSTGVHSVYTKSY